MTTRRHVKESVFSTVEEQQRKATCKHEWRADPALLFGYMAVDAQCTKCKTWRTVAVQQTEA